MWNIADESVPLVLSPRYRLEVALSLDAVAAEDQNHLCSDIRRVRSAACTCRRERRFPCLERSRPDGAARGRQKWPACRSCSKTTVWRRSDSRWPIGHRAAADMHLAAVLGVEEIAKPALVQAEAIPGRGVIIADNRAPRRFERGIGVLFRNDGELIAKRHAAQAKSDRGLVVFRYSRLHFGLPFCCLRGGRNARQGNCCRDCRAPRPRKSRRLCGSATVSSVYNIPFSRRYYLVTRRLALAVTTPAFAVALGGGAMHAGGGSGAIPASP